MADAAVEFLLGNLQQQLLHDGHVIRGAKDQVEKLENDLGLLRVFLRDSTQKIPKDGSLVRQIRDAVCEAHDIIDAFVTQAAADADSKNYFLRARYMPANPDVAGQVEYIGAKVKEICGDRNKLDFASLEIGHRDPEKHQVKLIARHKDAVKTVIGHLKEGRDELDVIPIIGMRGLGKTTLAREVFQDKAIKQHFPTRLWVHISREFSLRNVLLQILKGITDLDVIGDTDHDLAQTVRAYLDGGRFLLVIDNVWTVKAWNAIRKVLPKGNRDGKVIITSPDGNVGTHANPTREPLNLHFLTEEESWELLQYEVFGELNRCPEELEGIGKDIAMLSEGVPTAIVMIGGFLAKHVEMRQKIATINAWFKMSHSIRANYDMVQGASTFIASSYRELSYELRNCFLYLGVFPKDHEIPVWTLTRLWIAEGFIQHKDGQSLEETAEDNLSDLIKRNLVMVVKTNLTGKVKTCCVHDVIREFCNSQAGIREQNLFQEITLSKEGFFEPSFSDIEKCRRLCIHSELSRFLSQRRLNVHGVRSFLCFYNKPTVLDQEYISVIPNTFPLMRVLGTESFKFPHFPTDVCILVHLRYITLSIDDLNILPESISELWNLQTLLIDTKCSTLEIRADIWKLIQLRHLKTKATILLAVQGESDQACENLQTLTRLSPEYCTKEVLNRACNIKKLGICGRLATLLEGNYSLDALGRLENLKMVNDLPNESSSESPLLQGFPRSNFFPTTLKRLTLSATHLDWSHMSTLGSINSLQVLKLKDNAFTGQNWNAGGHGFRALEVLLIWKANLVSWKSSIQDFPILHCLVLKNCENLCEIPTELAKSLQKLSMEHVGEPAVECAKEIERKNEGMRMQEEQQASRGRFVLNIIM